MKLDGKMAVVTGGSRGLGLGLVEALVQQGARVTVVARGADGLAAVRDRLGGLFQKRPSSPFRVPRLVFW